VKVLPYPCQIKSDGKTYRICKMLINMTVNVSLSRAVYQLKRQTIASRTRLSPRIFDRIIFDTTAVELFATPLLPLRTVFFLESKLRMLNYDRYEIFERDAKRTQSTLSALVSPCQPLANDPVPALTNEARNERDHRWKISHSFQRLKVNG